jgi:DNA-binding response OmpR family regulator
MGAVVKNPITHFGQASLTRPSSTVFIDESLAHIPSINSKEIRGLSRFLPVLVFIDSSIIEKLADSEISVRESLTENSKSTKLLALLARAVDHFKSADSDSVVVFGDVVVDLSSHEVRHRGQPVLLTALEFKTLKYFMQNARRAISRDELLNEVWGYENYPCTRTVDNHILKLRQKLERDPSNPVHFRTLHGAGYKFLP